MFIITHYPRHLRACNVYPSNEKESTTHSFDVILRGQEIVTGCQLLHSHKELRSAHATRTHPIDSDSLGWRPYVAAHEIGMPPWGGFGCMSLFYLLVSPFCPGPIFRPGGSSKPLSRNLNSVDQASLTFCFAVGLNRFVQGFLGLADIRESVLFPRNAARLAP